MDIKDIEKLAELSRIEMSDEEKEKILGEMDAILDFVNQIQNSKIDITEKGVGEVRNVMREDCGAHESGKYTEDILREAPKTRGGYVEVKKIL